MKKTENKINQCKHCCCTDINACAGGCYWTNKEKNICSACVPNVFDELLKTMSYMEFITQLIMFEKAMPRESAKKVASAFIDNSGLASIFDMEQLFEEANE